MRITHFAISGAILFLLTQALAETAPKSMPGMEPFPAAVQQQLDRTLQAK